MQGKLVDKASKTVCSSHRLLRYHHHHYRDGRQRVEHEMGRKMLPGGKVTKSAKTKAKTTSSAQEKEQVSHAETQPEARSDLSSVTAFDYKFVEQSQEAKGFIG